MPAKYTPRRKAGKAKPRPEKPYPDFPLYAHPLGYWSKKIKGKIIHFGRWGRVVKGKLEHLPYEASWQEALAIFKARVDDAHAGRIQAFVVQDQPTSDGTTVRNLCNEFRTAKLHQMAAKAIGQRMYDDYVSITDLLIQQFGSERLVEDLKADDFERLRTVMQKRWGPVRLGNQITRVKSVFKYAYHKELIAKPIPCLGPQSSIFQKPSAAELRKHRAKNGERMLEAAEIRLVLDALEGKEVVVGKKKVQLATNPQLRAMFLLGVNCGFGNHDCATLPLSALKLDAGWITYSRPKTGIDRRCPLWQETVAALKAAIAERPKPKLDDAEGLVFVMPTGRPWLCRGIANPVSVAARDVLKALGINGRYGLGFYTLRHVFRTIADGARDQVAANAIMGHADNTMAGVYRERIDDSRLRAVVQHVHAWLFGQEGGAA